MLRYRPFSCASSRFGLGQPEGHVHGAIQLDGGRQLNASLLRLTSRGIEGAEAAVAVRHERAHAKFFGQGAGLLVMGCGVCNCRRLPLRRNVAEEAQSIRLVAALLVLAGLRQRPFGEGVCLLQVASQQLRLPQGETTEQLCRCAIPVAVVRSIACVSSDTASTTRPPRVYAAPKVAAISGK